MWGEDIHSDGENSEGPVALVSTRGDLVPQRHLAMLPPAELVVASCGYRPGMLLYIPQGTGQPTLSPALHNRGPEVNRTKAEHCCSLELECSGRGGKGEYTLSQEVPQDLLWTRVTYL